MAIKSTCPVPRCALLFHEHKGLKIVILHLVGGPYDDLLYETLLNAKEEQLAKVVELWNPDVIVGDFNGAPIVPDLSGHLVYAKATSAKQCKWS